MASWQGKQGFIGLGTALAASSCCLLPLAVVFVGLGSGAFMMTTMQFRPMLFPLGLGGLGVSYYLYFRERRRCKTFACAMVSKTLNLVTIGFRSREGAVSMPWKQSLSVGVAMLTCPCHLPILVGALAGTALGGWLSQHALVLTLGMASIFALALLSSFRALTRQETMPERRGQASKET